MRVKSLWQILLCAINVKLSLYFITCIRIQSGKLESNISVTE